MSSKIFLSNLLFSEVICALQGAARRINTQRKNVEIESVAAGKAENQQVVKKYFRLEVWMAISTFWIGLLQMEV